MRLKVLQLPHPQSSEGTLPVLYARWMDELLQSGIPNEPRATCQDCAMCHKGDGPPPDSRFYFDRSIKCCTYVPVLPNFLVGNILNDPDPDLKKGRESVQARIASRVALLPTGLGTSPAQDALYTAVGVNRAFGRNANVHCPHYVDESGMCGIHRHRNGVCSTWFCKLERGRTGMLFWNQLRMLFSHLEKELKAWCLLELDVGGTNLRRLFSEDYMAETRLGRMNGVLSDQDRRNLWGSWVDREEEFFRACGRKVSSLSFHQVLGLCGSVVHLHARACQDAYRDLVNAEIPQLLISGQFKILTADEDTFGVETWSPNDPCRIPKVLFEVLHNFDGRRSTGEVVRAIEAKTGIVLSRDFLQEMVDREVLVRLAEAPPEA